MLSPPEYETFTSIKQAVIICSNIHVTVSVTGCVCFVIYLFRCFSNSLGTAEENHKTNYSQILHIYMAHPSTNVKQHAQSLFDTINRNKSSGVSAGFFVCDGFLFLSHVFNICS